VTRLELEQDVDVALGPKVVAQDRAEEGQAPDAVALAEGGDGRSVDGDARRHRGSS
jgi:hypothetical protein